MPEIRITADQANQRLDRFLRKYYKDTPAIRLGDIYRSLRKGEIRLNSKRAHEDTRIQEGDLLLLPDQTLASETAQKLGFKIDLKQVASWIIFEDSDWLVFDKPAGITLQDNHSGQAAMIHYLNTYLASLDDYQKSQTFSPSFGYRLDKDTSGVLIVGKSYQALQYINQIIRERQIEKFYKTIVFGEIPNYGLIEHALQKTYSAKFQRGQMEVVKQGGLDAKTEYRKEKTREHSQLGKLSLLKVKLHTGRMHQIRIHLAQEGYPVLGDLVYGDPASNRILYKHLHIKRQLLHCQKYEFLDWNGKSLGFEAQLPQDFDQLLTFIS